MSNPPTSFTITGPIDERTTKWDGRLRRWMDRANLVLNGRRAREVRKRLTPVNANSSHGSACAFVRAPGSPHASICDCGYYAVWLSLQPWCLECFTRHDGDCR